MGQILAKRPRSLGMPLVRTGSRAARLGAFALERWSRMRFEAAGASLNERAIELSWLAENLCALHGLRAQLRGTPPSGPSVLVANHLSYFDPVVLAAHTPLTAVAKLDVAGWPLVGDTCRRLGVTFVDRGDQMSGAYALRKALRALDQGVSVLVFPEGTTTRGDEVLPFRRGIFGIAALAGVPVVPVALRYDRPHVAWVGDDAFLPHYVRAMAEPCTRVMVEYLSPLTNERGESAEGMAEAARRAIARALTTQKQSQTAARARAQHVFLASA
jgi:1-acyl-sn-glycerol-3-phosphate acyltransferase